MQLLAQEEARQRQAQQQLSKQTQPPVKTKMLRRLSNFVAEQSPPKAEESKGRSKPAKKPKGQGRGDLRGEKGRERRQKTRSKVEERADMDFVLLPLDDSGLTESSGPAGDWSTSLSGAGSPMGNGMMDEIGRQFLAVSKTPTEAKKLGAQARGPKLKRLSATDKGSVPKKKKGSSPAKAMPHRAMNESADSLTDLLPPLSSSHVAKHDGNVVTQTLQNTEGVKLPDSYDLFATRSKTRLPIVDSFPNSASNSEPTLESMEVSSSLLTSSLLTSSPPPPQTVTVAPAPIPPPPITSAPPPPPPSTTPLTPPGPRAPPSPPPPSSQLEGETEHGGVQLRETSSSVEASPRKSRTSQLLETMEEGEVETR